MHQLQCPQCTGVRMAWLAESSRTAEADYFECEECGALWAIDKHAPSSPLVGVPPDVVPALKASRPGRGRIADRR